MTTNELVHWAKLAEDAVEFSWNAALGEYQTTKHQAVLQTKPPFAKEAEVQICGIMVEMMWNEVQDWDYMLNELNKK